MHHSHLLRKTWSSFSPSVASLAAPLLLLFAAWPALAVPEMDLQQPSGTSVADGGSRNFGTVEYGSSASLLFTIRNTGTTALTLSGNPRVAVSGAHAADFTVTTQPASPVPAGGVTVQNGGFETPVQGTGAGDGFTYQPSGAGWTFGSSTGISRNGTSWYANPAPQGTQAGFLFGTGAVISQTINFPAAGSYLIHFSAANARTNRAGQITVAMDGTSLGNVLEGAPTDDVWRSFTIPYTCPAAGNHTLSLTISAAGVSVVDDVQITMSSFQVVFTPSAGGVRSATLSIANNDLDENPYNVTLTGTVPLRPGIELEQPAGTPLMTGKVAAWGLGNNGQLNVPPALSSVKAIAAGARSTQALRYDGTLAAWGDIIAPAGLSNLVAIESGEAHSVALRSDGTVVTWGVNSHDQLIIPAGLTGVTAITAGNVSSAALKSDGSTVVTWGYSVGQPPALASVVSIARGSTHTLALKSNGTVVAWGENFRGEANVPAGLTGVVAVAAGGYSSIAVKSDGTVVKWGGGPTPPAGLAGVVAVAVSPVHGLALKSDGTIAAWGDNTFGQASVPAGVVGVRAVAASADMSDATMGGHSVALLDSTVDFGAEATSASSAPKTFTIRNAGTAPLAISGVSVTGPDASRFTVSTAGMATTVPALGGQTTFSVTFTPGTIGAKHATLRVANNDGITGPFFVHLTGTGADPEAAVTGNGIGIADGDASPQAADQTDFGSVAAATGTVARTYTISNSGTGVLTLGAVTVGGAHAADFAITGAPASSVAAGGNTTFQVTFNPSAAGLRSATLSFANNDADENPFSFSIQGVGLSALDTWRLQHFGTTANAGAAAELFDFNNNGLVNLLEFAFGLNPRSTGNLTGRPAISRDAQGRLVVEFVRRKAATSPGISYAVETGANLASLAPLSLSGAAVVSLDATFERVTMTDPAITPQRFGRVRVLSFSPYVNDFNTGLGAATVRGSAVWTNQAVRLTDSIANQVGAVVLEGFSATPALSGFTAKFHVALGPTSSASPADGLSFAVGDLGSSAWGEAGPGTASSLAIGFDTFAGAGNDAIGIHVWVNGAHLAFNPTNPYTNGASVPVEISYDAATGLTIRFNNVPIFTNLTVPGFTFPMAGRFGIGARTGGATQRAVVDNLEITPR